MEREDAVILAARKEVQGHANVFLVKPILDVFEEIYARCMKMDGKMKTFQRALKEIPQWTSHIVSKCTDRIQQECDFLPQLITALFLSHIKILSSIKINKISHIRVKVPKREKFIHAVLIECAKAFYESPLLFRSGDKRTRHAVVNDAIEITVRRFLPLKDILSAYLAGKSSRRAEESESDSEEEEEIETPISEALSGAGSQDLTGLMIDEGELPDPPPMAPQETPEAETEKVSSPATVTIAIDKEPRAAVRKGAVFYRDPDVRDRVRM